MIKGIGIDIVELNRIGELLERKPHFADRILTERELEKYDKLQRKRKLEFLAGRFAAKEAFSKAVGTGIGKGLSFLDIEVGQDEKGKPYINKPYAQGVHLSITHSSNYAFAQVVIEE
ncbi:holo-ACP synthase [Niallia circulans]|uniref:Holo-[acyl-carrier-protein] synthase n=1 Tax=Niallia circulans TaxID=1397 RepID=A0A553SGU4_NIACI|nr:holo-ACP synthase [Niallia circulans]TRZ36212.1 holo-ACP synthase [Niallia circulans]